LVQRGGRNTPWENRPSSVGVWKNNIWGSLEKRSVVCHIIEARKKPKKRTTMNNNEGDRDGNKTQEQTNNEGGNGMRKIMYGDGEKRGSVLGLG